MQSKKSPKPDQTNRGAELVAGQCFAVVRERVMLKTLELSSFEEFEVWLDTCITHETNRGLIPDLIRKGNDGRFFEQIQTAQEILEELIRCSGDVENLQKQEMQNIELSLQFPDKSLAPVLARQQQLCWQCLGTLSDFSKKLENIKLLYDGLQRLSEVKASELAAAGYLMVQFVEQLLAGESVLYLRQKNFDWRLHHTLQREVSSSIEEGHLRDRVEAILGKLFLILKLLHYIRAGMRRSYRARKLALLLALSYFKCRDLFGVLDDSRKQFAATHSELAEAFQTLSSGLKMEAGKAFKLELREMQKDTSTEQAYPKVERALLILQNALQGSIDNLARALHLQHEFFWDQSDRHKEAVALLDDLHAIYELVSGIEDTGSTQNWVVIQQSLKRFQDSSMKALFARDRETLQQFAEEIEYCDPKARLFVLHRFEVYISSLIMEVKKRSALAALKDNSASA
jgi:hypothetical protein